MSKLVVNTNLNLVDYMTLVDDIVLEYFDIDGEFQPHIGILNCMRLFYNLCVIESDYDDELNHNITEAIQMEKLVVDKDFINAFNKAIYDNCDICLDFGNAYRNAMEIVEVKKSSFNNIINNIKNVFGKVVEMISPTLSEENIKNISQIAKDMSNGKVTAEAIVEAYANSQKK